MGLWPISKFAFYLVFSYHLLYLSSSSNNIINTKLLKIVTLISGFIIFLCGLSFPISDVMVVDTQSGGTHRMTSDQFFAENKSTFDLIFIDGLHVYEQVLKDIDNSLKVLNENGVILIHDCLPSKIWHQTIPQTHSSWNGDVWKSIVKSRAREDIDTYTIKADQGKSKFNFEGVNSPDRGNFKLSFGGNLVPYYNIKKFH